MEIVSGDQNGTITVWNLIGKVDKVEYSPTPDSEPIRSLSVSSDASLLVVGAHRGKVFFLSFSFIMMWLFIAAPQLFNDATTQASSLPAV